jgi:integrase
VLRDHLDQHLLGLGWSDGLVFGSTSVRPFAPSPVVYRAMAAWGWKRERVKGEPRWTAQEGAVEPIGLHECRHTFASLMIAAGVNAKALSTYMGHANISITLDRYGHLMPGNEEEAAGLLDAYLMRASGDVARATLAPVLSESGRIQSDPVGSNP